MNKVPYMPVYPDTQLAETANLPLDARGALYEIYAYLWLYDGWLSDDDKNTARLLRISTTKWKKIKTKLDAFFVYENGLFTCKNLLAKYAHAAAKIEKCRASGKLGAEVKRLQRNNNVKDNANAHTQYRPTPLFAEPLQRVLERTLKGTH